jgi:hypothetical protein
VRSVVSPDGDSTPVERRTDAVAKRVDLFYGGRLYSIGGREIEDVRAEIADALARGHGWLTVNDGEGVAQATELLISAGVDVTLAAIPND